MELDRDPAEEDASPGNPRRYKPVRHLYSSTTPCVNASGSSNVMSKKVKASKVGVGECREMEVEEGDRGRKLEKGRIFGVGLEEGGEMEEEEGERERKLEKGEIFGLRLEKLEKGRSFGLGLEEGGGVEVEGGGKLEKGGSFGLGMEEGGENVEKGGSFGLGLEEGGEMEVEKKPLVVYSRRAKRARVLGLGMSYLDKLMRRVGAVEKEESLREESVGKLNEVKAEVVEEDSAGMEPGVYGKKRKHALKYELIGLGGGSGFAVGFGGPRLRKHIAPTIVKKDASSSPGKAKKWVELSFEDADPSAFVGLQCKVFWPMDDDWYLGSVSAYDPETQKHLVEYKDSDAERLILSNERIKFHVSTREVQILNLKYRSPDIDKNASSYDEMLALAVSYDDSQDLEAGDIVWAKLSGYSMWPALVMKETCVGALGVPKPHQKERMVPVQFFGTHDFARINLKQVKSFFRGLLSSFHLKSKQLRFQHSLEEAKMYLSQQQLPDRMIEMQKANDGVESRYDQDRMESRDDSSGDEEMQRRKACINVCPIEIGDLCITSLGKINDSEYFRGKQYIWPEGYMASRKFMSISNPTAKTIYKMEILRNPKSKARPLFRVTLDDGEQIEGSNPNACWKDIYARIKRNFNKSSCSALEEEKLVNSGSYMFGLSYPKVVQLIQDLPNSRLSSKHIEDCSILPSGYRAVRVEWKDIDRCNVCHMDEEYEDNLFLQCDKCRMMVHARCYGEIEPLDGVLWYCNLCRSGAPRSPPPCCLCPVVGGAMKPTTDGRWAHLTCAMWIPETCLLDIKRMEPIDGLNRISKDRWKLLCSICGVSYGACIQCCSNNCYAAYHPLCARAAGLCVELENEDQLHLLSFDEDDGQCVRLVSFCKKHRQPHNERSPSEEQVPEPVEQCATCNPPSNPSGCARTEPYNFFGRRGQKEPQILAAASTKRLFLENQPYLVRGCHQNAADNPASCGDTAKSFSFSSVPKMKHYHYDSTCSISSMLEKYQYMKATFKRRLAFGKSRIHGFGVFAKIEHKAGDMVIEYAGELVRPPIADIRERRIYNSLVGAGTYMFRIDNERVVDATRAGTIAHLINHSCEPNCYSRTITVNGNDHIIIFAKRDINQWEELSYDYRFFSKDEQLACFCGSSKCHGVVNDIETEEQITNLVVPRSELIPWHEE